MKRFASEIYEAVRAGRLKEPFRAADVKKACPDWVDNLSRTFLSKQAVGNGETTELFMLVQRGLYRTIRDRA